MFSRDERRVVLCMDSNICCKRRSLLKKIETKKSNVKPLHPNTPLSNVNPERDIEALKLERKENKELHKRLEKEIQLKCCWSRLTSDFNMIMSENLGKMTPFMKLFWEQQKQFTKNKSATSNRYHPIAFFQGSICL